MINIIRGTANAGKSEYVIKEIANRVKAGKPSLLIVPEQTSFSYEKLVLEQIEQSEDLVDVTSFTKLCKFLSKEKQSLGNISAQIYMHLALNSVQGELKVYKNHAKTSAFISQMLAVSDECDSAGITAESLMNLSKKLESSSLKSKSYDIALILQKYKELQLEKAYNESDSLIVSAKKIEEEKLYKGYAIYIDDFSGFSSAQYQFIFALSNVCESVNICLISNQKYTDRTIKRLGKVNFIDLKKENPKQIEKYLLMPKTTLTESYAVANLVYDLVKQGYRYRDIAIVAKTDNRLKKIKTALEEYKIPAFFDTRSDIDSALFLQGLKEALYCATNERYANIVALLKNPFCGITEDKALALENYAYIWSLKLKDFKVPFTKNPDGFKQNQGWEERLAELEETRKQLWNPIEKLSTALKKKHGQDIASGVYDYLKDINVIENFKAKFDGDFLERQSQYYGQVCTILDIFYDMDANMVIEPKDAVKLLDLALGSITSALPPRHLDEVTCGIMERMRIDYAKVVIMVSVIKDEFPCYKAPTGLFTNRDKNTLIANDFSLVCSDKEFVEKEELFVSATMSAPSEKLFISCPATELSGQKLYPSLIAKDLPVYNIDEFIHVNEPDINKNHSILPNTAKDLFGTEMALSASRLEKYYDCPYSYFVAYGLDIHKLEKAELTAANRGSLLHHVLENILPTLQNLNDDAMQNDIHKYVNSFIDTNNFSDREKAKYQRLEAWLFVLLKHMQSKLAIDPFKPSKFELVISKNKPQDVSEYVPALTEQTLDGQVNIYLNGKVDRVDVANIDGKKYVRIVDYKTSGKNFSIQGVFDGINIQMLVYLFAIEKNGQNDLKNTNPAGVLYQPILGSYKEKAEDVLKDFVPEGILLDNSLIDKDNIRTKKNEKTFLDEQDFATLRDVVKERMQNMAQNVIAGNIESVPYVDGEKHDACRYCDAKYLCGYREGDRTREKRQVTIIK